MRRIICVLLAVSVLLSFAVPSFAVESEEPQFGSINVEYSDSYGSIEQLAVMVQDGHVYANADVLSDRLGYRFEQNDNVVSIYAVSNISYQEAPLLAVHFRINSADVSYNPLFGAEYKYTAPAPCVENDNGIWVPLTYTLVLLGGNSTLLEDTLLIQMPRDNVLSVAAMIAKNDKLLSFDWVDDFGYSETTTNITNGAGRIVTLFSGLLEFDGTAWLSLVDWDAFDRKFGKSLVIMLCSRSQDELDEDIWQVEAMLDLLSDDGKLGGMLRNKQMRIDSDVTAWQTACENYLKLMEDGSGSPAKYNLLYRQCERAMDQQMQFAALGGEGMIQIQDALSSATNALDIASIIGEAVSYMTEFQQTDEYLFAVLEDYLNRRTETDYLPDATAQAMEHYLRVMDLGTLGYSAYSYIEENWLKCIVDESGLDALLGAPANALLFTWDIMSGTIPFYSDGLDAVENREISNYAQKMQNDVLENLNSLLSDFKYNTSELNAADCVQLSEYCYVYLKASYIARATAIKSLENTSDEFQNKMKSRLDSETELNQKIAGYLSVLSSANADNECYILGFLAENNDEYLEDYSDDNLSDIIDVDGIDGTALVSDAFSDYGIRNDGYVNNYRIPKINIFGKATEETNAIIYDDLYYGAYEKIENKRGDCGDSGITYSWTEQNGVVSILARWAPEDYTGHGPIYHYTYNASSKTGALLSVEEVVGSYGLTLDEYYLLAKEKIETYYVQANGSRDEYVGYNMNYYDEYLDVHIDSYVDYYDEYLKYFLSDDNLKRVLPFINITGDLCIVTQMESIVATESYEALVNLTGDTTPEPPAFSWDIPEENENRYEDVQSEATKITHAINISEDEAYDMACEYWNYTEGDVDEGNGYELYISDGGLLEGSDGNHYYGFRLRWWVIEANHGSTIDYLYINAETGECSYDMSGVISTNQTTELTPLQYWIEYCDTKRLAENDLETFDADDCRLARNAIFAKSGRKFNDDSLQAYYEQFDWYHPTVSPDDFSNSMLNDIQSYNLDLIIAYEESRGYR